MQQEVFNLTELDTISFECVACHTEIVLRADRPRGKGQRIICPLCHHELPNAARIFDWYQAMHEEASSLGDTVKLRAAAKLKADS